MENNVENAKLEEQLQDEQVVTPWEVSAKEGGKIDYDKLIDQFGCQRLDPSLIDRVERLTGRPAHVFLRRGVFFAHRDLTEILDARTKEAISFTCILVEDLLLKLCIWGI